MSQQTQTGGTGEVNHVATAPSPRRAPVRRSVIFLAIATVALAVFILGLGDWRRMRMARSEAELYANELSKRMGDGLALPLNLEIAGSPELKPKLHRFDWLTSEQARRLRSKDGRFIVAQTAEVRQVLRSNGRAVIFFQAGEFQCEWLRRSKFDALYAAQAR